MEDSKSKKPRQNPGSGQGVGVPAKGDSAPGNSPFDPYEGATISDVPLTPPAAPAKPPAKPPTRVAHPDVTLAGSLPGSSAAPRSRAVSGMYQKQEMLQPGDMIGGRYEILLLLGEGGMGAVYKAMDREVERTVALKLIRPELAANPAILMRFKQELLTAHQVTHKNVIRTYDIGEADGVKFITMEFVEGSDLRRIMIDNGKLPPSRAIEIIRQVCVALDAAHSAGIIHRDLKPQNIMQEAKSGRILVMDFGLARSMESEGMTQTGALLGTIEYMSPEQSMGKTLDQRSDIFAVGLIFYELLTGNTPYKADTAMASLLRRNQERAVPAAELDASIPKGLSDIVAKCLERDLEHRYLNVQQILADLDAFQGARPTYASISLPLAMPAAAPAKPALPWKWVSVAALAIIVVTGGWMLRGKLSKSDSSITDAAAVKAPEVSLAIVPFRNASGDASLDWLGRGLADMLSTDVGQSASLRTVSPDRLHQVLKDLRIPDKFDFDGDTLKKVAEFSNADTLVWGSYAKYGDQIRIDATLQDLKHNRTAALKIEAANEKQIPATVDGLAELIRKNLAVSADVVKELKASSFQPTSQSVEALRSYNQALGLQRNGKSLDAQKLFEQATEDDPSFALAYSKLAQTYASRGYDDQAEQAARRSMDLSANLPQAERYLITAIHAQVTRNFPEAIKAYENLAKASPGNADVQAALAGLYEETGDLSKASKYNQAILAANPKDITARLSAGRLAINSGDPQAALDSLNRALSLSVELNNPEQKAASLHLIGVAYWRMNRPEDALRNYQEELGIWKQVGEKRGIARSMNEMAKVQALMGDNKNSLANFQQAMGLWREIGDKRGLGDTSIDLGNYYDDRGDHDQALKMYKEALQIERDIANEELQSVSLNNIGAVYFEKAQYDDARAYYQQALQLREKLNVPRAIAETVFNLAETSVRMGQYDQAVSQYMRTLDLWRKVDDKRDAAISSYTLGTMFDYQGRYGSALSSKDEALKTFQDLKDKTTWMVDISGGYGQSLTLAGRGEEAQTFLTDALGLARELKNDGMVAQVLVYQGNAAYYRGDAKSARPLYEQALQAATHSKEPDKILSAKIALARIAAEDGAPQQAIATLRQLKQQADEQGVVNRSVECSVLTAEALLRSHENEKARQELNGAILRADKIGLKPLSAKAYFLLGNVLRASGDASEAQQNYRRTLELLEGMRQEKGAEKTLERADLKAIHDEATRQVQGGAGK